MGIIYVYPGTFFPPTFGHLEIVKKAALLFGELYVVCSENPDKAGKTMFTPEECAKLWSFYALPENVRVVTLKELTGAGIDFKNVVMVRGVRDDRDFEYEKRVIMGNFNELGIDKYFVIVSEEKFKTVSSTLARKLARANNPVDLCNVVAPEVMEILIEKYKKRLRIRSDKKHSG